MNKNTSNTAAFIVAVICIIINVTLANWRIDKCEKRILALEQKIENQ